MSDILPSDLNPEKLTREEIATLEENVIQECQVDRGMVICRPPKSWMLYPWIQKYMVKVQEAPVGPEHPEFAISFFYFLDFRSEFFVTCNTKKLDNPHRPCILSLGGIVSIFLFGDSGFFSRRNLFAEVPSKNQHHLL